MTIAQLLESTQRAALCQTRQPMQVPELRQGVAAAHCALLHSPCPPAGCSSAKAGALL